MSDTTETHDSTATHDSTDTHDSAHQPSPPRPDGGSDPAATASHGHRSEAAHVSERGSVWITAHLRRISYRWVQASFAAVFFYFGLQKWPIVQGASPVRPPVRAFVEAVGFGGWLPLSPAVGLLGIGVYEVTLGLLWLATIVEETTLGRSRVFLAAALMTLVHQLVTFLPLVMVPTVAFRQTQLWLPVVGTVPFALALDWLAAFILKNLLFLGALFYVTVEWVDRYGPTSRS